MQAVTKVTRGQTWRVPGNCLFLRALQGTKGAAPASSVHHSPPGGIERMGLTPQEKLGRPVLAWAPVSLLRLPPCIGPMLPSGRGPCSCSAFNTPLKATVVVCFRSVDAASPARPMWAVAECLSRPRPRVSIGQLRHDVAGVRVESSFHGCPPVGSCCANLQETEDDDCWKATPVDEGASRCSNKI
jgi:hypothetical protein